MGEDREADEQPLDLFSAELTAALGVAPLKSLLEALLGSFVVATRMVRLCYACAADCAVSARSSLTPAPSRLLLTESVAHGDVVEHLAALSGHRATFTRIYNVLASRPPPPSLLARACSDTGPGHRRSPLR